MPKQKTHSGAGKRFRVTANGKLKRGKQGKSHSPTLKETKRKRRLRAGDYVDKVQEKTMRNMIYNR